jgi:hypothetical protein
VKLNKKEGKVKRKKEYKSPHISCLPVLHVKDDTNEEFHHVSFKETGAGLAQAV